jgi:hypothetical protein
VISVHKLDTIFQALEAFRGDGRTHILFDSRDRGNYSAYNWETTVQMLRRADSTGLAEALLLDEMVEATIAGSQVKLASVIREEGFVAKVSQILAIKADLHELIGPMQDALISHLETALSSVSEAFGTPASREVAVCFRDAIYCLDRGLKLRWIVCDAPSMAENVPLAHSVSQFADIAEFVDALRVTLPMGAHLARIGLHNTAIGIKQPGRIAYLSSMGINQQSGKMEENRANNYLMAESLDLDTAVERYPQWVTTTGSSGLGRQTVVHGLQTHEMNDIRTLPRDRLIWLAMLVDMATQRMAKTDPASVQLTETMVNALPGALPSRLPVIVKPNWVVDNLTLEAMFDSLGLSPWEQGFFRPALSRLSKDVFLPLGDRSVGLRLDTFELCDYPESEFSSHMNFHAAADARNQSIRMVTLSSDWVGDKAEIDAARRQIFGRNLVDFLMAWGNRQWTQFWNDQKDWFEATLAPRIDAVVRHPCVQRRAADYYGGSGPRFFKQNPKRKTYAPRCFFNVKSEVTDTLLITPQTSRDVVEILGLSGEDQLPEMLRGWSRAQGWTTGHSAEAPPYGTHARWVFRRKPNGLQGKGMLEATVSVNRANLDFDISSLSTGEVSMSHIDSSQLGYLEDD